MSILTSLLQPPRRYLRYLHLREAVVIARPRTVLIVGAGRGVAEVAIAKEFPDISFHLTDHDFPHPRIERAQKLAQGLGNVTFGHLDILSPEIDEQSDLVGSVEVLEHIKEDDRAAANMRRLAAKHVFCLVPFATAEDNANAAKRQRVWDNNEHYVVGYDPQRLEQLFPNPQVTRGAYWRDISTRLKSEVAGLSPAEIESQSDRLVEIAHRDLRPDLPASMIEAVGIWTLARTGAS